MCKEEELELLRKHLTQIKAQEDHRSLELIDVWSSVIPARESSKVLAHLKTVLPEDLYSLNHLRRLIKEEHRDNVEHLRILICSTETIPNQDTVEQIVSQVIPNTTVETRKASKYPAYTKEQSAQWSQISWPIMWRGNPTMIKTELTDTELNQIKEHLNTLTDLCKTADPRELPIATLIVDPVTDNVLVSNTDQRMSKKNPLHHSVMDALFAAATAEAERRQKTQVDESDMSGDKNYLCLNLHVYTTHEPCTMCSMALVHSRIGRLIYLRQCEQSGGISPESGAHYSVHWNKQLNWRYEAWTWSDEASEPSEASPKHCLPFINDVPALSGINA